MGMTTSKRLGLLQALSWTLFERVTFDRTRVTSVDWSAYPILRFGDVPHSIEVHIIDRPGDGFFGVAEAAQRPSGAALANAIRTRQVCAYTKFRSRLSASGKRWDCNDDLHFWSPTQRRAQCAAFVATGLYNKRAAFPSQ